MNIVVIGAGGVGGYFGGKLAQAGNNVTFVVRGKHFEAIKNSGLKVKSVLGDFHIFPKVIKEVAEIDMPDLIILAVKSWQIEEIAIKLKPFISKNTIILPLQNGADNADRLRTILHPENVLAGLCMIVSKIESPGVIDHFAIEPQIVFGEYDNNKSNRVINLQELFEKSGIDGRISDDIHLDIWRKFLFIATVSGTGAVTRSPFGIMREHQGIRQLLYQIANEIVAIANARNITLNNEHIEMIFKVIDSQNHETTASMQRDFMAGKPSELDVFNGYIVREGKRLDIATPANSFVYNCLWPQETIARS